MRRLVADEVWGRLDPYAGVLPARARRRLVLAAGIATLLAIVVAVVWQAGLLTPRLVAGSHSGGSSPNHQFDITMTVENRNTWAPVEVLGAGRDGPGLELVDTAGTLPATLAPGETLTVTLVYRVTGCGAVTDRAWPVPVRVARWWGTQTLHAHLPKHSSDEEPDGSRVTEEVEWQHYYASLSCGA